MDIEDVNLELDTKWIDDFEALDEDYKAFYREDLTYIKFNYIYAVSYTHLTLPTIYSV